MKKRMLSSAMLLSTFLFAMPAYSAEQDIWAQHDTSNPPVVSIDVVWGSLLFHYTSGDTKNWDPMQHQYTTISGTPEWQSEHPGVSNVIAITNHSNTPLTSSFRYTPYNGFSSVSCHFGVYHRVERSVLPVSEGQDSGRTDIAELTLSGTLDQKLEHTSVGSVTLTIESGKYLEQSRYQYRDISTVQGNKLLLGRYYSCTEPTNELIQSQRDAFAERGNRMIRSAEVAGVLRLLHETDPSYYQEVSKAAIICEDGLYQQSGDEPEQYYFIEVMEKML